MREAYKTALVLYSSRLARLVRASAPKRGCREPEPKRRAIRRVDERMLLPVPQCLSDNFKPDIHSAHLQVQMSKLSEVVRSLRNRERARFELAVGCSVP